jgi:nucleotide-binding universal stress UspA family protein
MRVLLAIDGSPPSRLASELVAHIAWPPGSSVRLYSAVAIAFPIMAGPGQYIDPATIDVIEQARLDTARRLVDETATTIRRDGLTVETAVSAGPAGGEILDQAVRFGAELIVVGSRGHGTLGSLLLGSVSAELVDHAPCPVLVARRPGLAKAVLALDGSAAAGQALELVASWPIFRSVTLTVVSVAGPAPLLGTATVPAVEAKLDAALASLATSARDHAQKLANDATARLAAAGITATASALTGDPAHAIVEAADAAGADLIVMGSRGLTGLVRLRLASVARAVLHAASASVLVVHDSPGTVGPGAGGRTDMSEHRRSRDEAYADEPDYTSPEMQPGHGEDHPDQPPGERAVGGVMGLALGIPGAVLAGEGAG